MCNILLNMYIYIYVCITHTCAYAMYIHLSLDLVHFLTCTKLFRSMVVDTSSVRSAQAELACRWVQIQGVNWPRCCGCVCVCVSEGGVLLSDTFKMVAFLLWFPSNPPNKGHQHQKRHHMFVPSFGCTHALLAPRHSAAVSALAAARTKPWLAACETRRDIFPLDRVPLDQKGSFVATPVWCQR